MLTILPFSLKWKIIYVIIILTDYFGVKERRHDDMYESELRYNRLKKKLEEALSTSGESIILDGVELPRKNVEKMLKKMEEVCSAKNAISAVDLNFVPLELVLSSPDWKELQSEMYKMSNCCL